MRMGRIGCAPMTCVVRGTSWYHDAMNPEDFTLRAMASNLVAPLLLVVRPGAPSSVLVSNSDGLHPTGDRS